MSGTAVDPRFFSFSQADFAGRISGNTNLDFTIEVWNSTKTTRLASTTYVPGEPIKADVYVAPSFAVYGGIFNWSPGQDADADGYYETFRFDVGIDADVVNASAIVYGRIVCTTTGQAWWSSSSWNISGTATDYRYFAFSEADFAGYISGNVNLDFTVEIWNSTRTTLLASDGSVSGEPIRADRVTLPDLVVNSLLLSSSSVTAGGTVDVSFSIRNQGGLPASLFSNQIRLTSASGLSQLLATRNISSLAAGATSATFTETVTIPSTTAAGSYSVIVTADVVNTVNESNESNNVASVGIIINRPPTVTFLKTIRADTLVEVPPGGTFPHGVGVIFRGTVSDPDGDTVKMEVELRRVDESLFGTPTIETIGFVPGGSLSTPSRMGLIASVYKWQARAVDSKGAASGWTTIATFTIQQGANLIVEAVSASPFSATAGISEFDVSVSVRNNGAVPSGAFSTQVYLLQGTTPAPSGSGVLVGSLQYSALGNGQARTLTGRFRVPANTPAREYRLWAHADPLNDAIESDDSLGNNTAMAANLFEVFDSPKLAPFDESTSLGSRIPLIFVHGIWVDHRRWTESGGLVDMIQANAALNATFKAYYFDYPSPKFSEPPSHTPSIHAVAKALSDAVAAFRSKNDGQGFGNQKLAFVAHSQGGLVVRSYLEQHLDAGVPAGEKTIALFTLGTPHHGVLLSETAVIVTLAAAFGGVGALVGAVAGAVLHVPHYDDMRWDGDEWWNFEVNSWLRCLNNVATEGCSSTAGEDRLKPITHFFFNRVWPYVARGDAFVPDDSAALKDRTSHPPRYFTSGWLDFCGHLSLKQEPRKCVLENDSEADLHRVLREDLGSTILVTPGSNGAVTGPAASVGGIDCSATSRRCEELYGRGATVTLTAVPNTGYRVSRWSVKKGDGSTPVACDGSSASTCNIPAADAPRVSVLFEPISVVDVTPPQIAITSPTTSATYAASVSSISLAGTASDASGVAQVTWSNNRGGSGTASGTTAWSATVALQLGINIITVTARDAAGNSGTDTLSVTYPPLDTVAPIVTITSPTSNPTYSTNTSSITLAGTGSDNVGVTQVSWVNDRGGAGTAIGTTNWTASGILLQSGTNVLTVTARDAAGNTGIDALTVTYTPPDLTAPDTTITSGPTGIITTRTASFSWTGSDNVTPTAQLVYAHRLDPLETSFSSFDSATTHTYSSLANGNYTFYVKSRDLAANEDATPATRSFSVAVDTVAPDTTITSGPTDTINTDTAAFAWTGSDNNTPTGNLTYATRLDPVEPTFSAFGNSTTRTYTSLAGGTYTFYVKARDEAGNEDLSPATRSFTIAGTQTDPLLGQQWHLMSRSSEPAGANVQPAWPVTRGPGVVIGIVDDGLQRTHPDLQPNYVAALSRDFNDNDADPSPTNSNRHGTAVAGVAAARGDNSIGVSGVAPLGSLAGLRLVAASTSDAQEAAALAHELQAIHILNNSWGPPDDGRTLARPGPLTQAAIQNAITNGRGGKGRIFVWAAGNGRENLDNCGFDGYASSRYVIPVGALTDTRTAASYSEPCSALFVVAPSSGGNRGITTTDLVGSAGYSSGDYTSSFGGTSGAAPVVSGVADLVVARNPSLTWRDVKHILRQSSSRSGLPASGWTSSAYPHHEQYGFGQVDAAAAVSKAATWVNVPPEQSIPGVSHSIEWAIPDNDANGITDRIDIPAGFANFAVEHIEVEFTATHTWRGDIEVTLISPSGTVSHLATVRPDDASGAGFTAWRFTSVRHWGESAAGSWTLRVADRAAGDVGTWNSWTLRLYGTGAAPRVSGVGLAADKPSPQPAGTTITWSATPVDGVAPYQYKWMLYDGVNWTLLTNWGPDNSFAWTPTVANANYRIGVWVRSAGNSADEAEFPQSAPFQIVQTSVNSLAPSAVVTSVALTADKGAPQAAHTPVTFTATPSGGVAPHQYEWVVFDGLTWTFVTGWTTSNTYVWTPTVANPNYRVGVWVRSAGNNAEAPEYPVSVAFAITAANNPSPSPNPSASVTLTADKPSPQATGTAILFTATGTGGTAPYQYKWWQVTGGTRQVLQEWSAAATVTWTPMVAAATYQMEVWARSSGNAADVAEATSALPYVVTATAPTPSPFVTNVALTADKTAPQPPNTTMTFTATPTGGTAPHQYKWVVFDGLAWRFVTGWTVTNTYVWTPAVANPNYRVGVWVRSAGNNADVPEYPVSVAFAITAAASPTPTPSPSASVTVTADKPSPQSVGTAITFTAAGTGGTAPYQYKWWQVTGGARQVLQEWSAAAMVTWTPTVAAATYQIEVWARSSGNAADAAEATSALPYVITATAPTPSPFVTNVALTADKSAPQPPNTTMTFTATPTGGTAPHQYKWVVFDGLAWRFVTGWTVTNTYVWTPAVANPNYRVGVWVRSAGNNAEAPEYPVSIPFAITATTTPSPSPSPSASVTLTADKPSPQSVGTAITFTATGTGGTAPYSYKWWQVTGGARQLLQEWSAAATVTWTPAVAAATYQIEVWARSSGNAADAAEATSALPYVITANAPTPGPSPFVTNVTLTADKTAPQAANTTITFAATPTGGTAPHQYKWVVFNGLTWTFVTGWVTANTYVWTPAVANPNYRVGVWVRSAGNNAEAPEYPVSIPFAITAAASPTPTPSPTASVTLTADKPSPQATGTAILFTAAGAGGTAPYSYKWWQVTGGARQLLQEWSAAATVTWTPTAAAPSYQIEVWIRSSGNSADAAEATSALPYVITATAPTPSPFVTNVALTADKTAPQPPNTTITFTATPTGGTAPQQYKWVVFNGLTWTFVTGWVTTNTYAWTPAVANPNYRVGVWVRSAGNNADVPEYPVSIPFAITATTTPSPSASVTLTADKPSPQATGTAILFTATGTGGTAPYQYKWWQVTGGARQVLQEWSAAATLSWTPTVAAPTYQIEVWVRSSGNSADAAEATSALPYVITGPVSSPVVTSVTLTTDKPAPQAAGTPITFTATPSGGVAPHQYKWVVFDGLTWTFVTGWTPSNPYVWTPPVANANYRVGVWVRSAGNAADWPEVPVSVPFAITSR